MVGPEWKFVPNCNSFPMCCSLRTIQFGGWRWLLWWHGRDTVQCSSHQEQFSVSQALTTDLQVTVTVRYWLTPSDFNFLCFVTIWHGERQWDWQSLNLNLDDQPQCDCDRQVGCYIFLFDFAALREVVDGFSEPRVVLNFVHTASTCPSLSLQKPGGP